MKVLPEPTRVEREALRADSSPPTEDRWEWNANFELDGPWPLLPMSVFVSCWNLSEHENASLWSVYGKAIAIESKVSSLRDALEPTDHRVHIGAVTYIDYENDHLPADNALRAILHKRLYFDNERELRAVITGNPTERGDGFRIAAQYLHDPRAGIVVPVELARLVHRVWIAPGGGLLQTVVSGLVERYELPVEVRLSHVDEFPIRF
jgi:hypothetical protein